MFQKAVSIILSVAFVLAVMVAGAHVHVGEVEHQADCTVCRVAHDSIDSVDGQRVGVHAPWTYIVLSLTDSVHIPDNQGLLRQAPKTSPPAPAV